MAQHTEENREAAQKPTEPKQRFHSTIVSRKIPKHIIREVNKIWAQRGYSKKK